MGAMLMREGTKVDLWNRWYWWQACPGYKYYEDKKKKKNLDEPITQHLKLNVLDSKDSHPLANIDMPWDVKENENISYF